MRGCGAGGPLPQSIPAVVCWPRVRVFYGRSLQLNATDVGLQRRGLTLLKCGLIERAVGFSVPIHSDYECRWHGA
jgi:hypothetical protein